MGTQYYPPHSTPCNITAAGTSRALQGSIFDVCRTGCSRRIVRNPNQSLRCLDDVCISDELEMNQTLQWDTDCWSNMFISPEGMRIGPCEPPQIGNICVLQGNNTPRTRNNHDSNSNIEVIAAFINLNGLNDVNVPNPQDNQVLTYDAGIWVAQTPSNIIDGIDINTGTSSNAINITLCTDPPVPFAGCYINLVSQSVCTPTDKADCTVSIGCDAGLINQQAGAIAIGCKAGKDTQGSESIAIGNGAGETNQENSAVAIGEKTGKENQQVRTVAIGYRAAYRNQAANSVAIGASAGTNTQQTSAIAIGHQTGYRNQRQFGIAIGEHAGYEDHGIDPRPEPVPPVPDPSIWEPGYAIAIGSSAGHDRQSRTSIAIGRNAGNENQGIDTRIPPVSPPFPFDPTGDYPGRAIAIGVEAGNTDQRMSSIALGYRAGLTNQGYNSGVWWPPNSYEGRSIAIGHEAGQTNQELFGIAIGGYAGMENQGTSAIAIGLTAAHFNQDVAAIAIGTCAGLNHQSFKSVAVGNGAGSEYQGISHIDPTLSGFGIAIGSGSGALNQGNRAIAIGFHAGYGSDGLYGQGVDAIAIGNSAGSGIPGGTTPEEQQGVESIAIGSYAGQTNQGAESIAIGSYAGQTNQGDKTIALGFHAGRSDQPDRTFYIGKECIRNTITTPPLPTDAVTLQYSPSTGEIFYTV